MKSILSFHAPPTPYQTDPKTKPTTTPPSTFPNLPKQVTIENRRRSWILLVRILLE
jgi:hypothetical protein